MNVPYVKTYRNQGTDCPIPAYRRAVMTGQTLAHTSRLQGGILIYFESRESCGQIEQVRQGVTSEFPTEMTENVHSRHIDYAGHHCMSPVHSSIPIRTIPYSRILIFMVEIGRCERSG